MSDEQALPKGVIDAIATHACPTCEAPVGISCVNPLNPDARPVAHFARLVRLVNDMPTPRQLRDSANRPWGRGDE